MTRFVDTIEDIKAEQRYDSRGVPTVQITVMTKGGAVGVSMAPSGASRGTHEVSELRDGGTSFSGLAVKKVAKNFVVKFLPKVKGVSIFEQDLLDQILTEPDETAKTWGGNFAIATSQAIAKAGALSLHLPLWQYLRQVFHQHSGIAWLPNHKINLCANVLNGGVHALGGPTFQEFWVVSSQGTMAQQLETIAEFYFALRENFKKNKKLTLVGDEGGLVPLRQTSEETLSYLHKMLREKGFLNKLALGLDLAASEFYTKNFYTVDGKKYSREQYLSFILKLQKSYSLAYLEDPASEDDLKIWSALTEQLAHKTWLIGDDLFTSQGARLKQGIEADLANAILLKPNQVGSVTGLMKTATLAKKNNYKTIVSHRSGETSDIFIADLAVAINADAVKFGPPARGERLIKYERLLSIEQELNESTKAEF